MEVLTSEWGSAAKVVNDGPTLWWIMKRIIKRVEVESVQGPTGGRVELPCDVSPALSADKVGLVIWYKQGHETPIYSPEDSGQYRCRVDFIKSPTKNTRLNLTVLSSEGNDEVHGNILGPYDKGAEVNLTCIAVGGRPIARVSWWKSHALLANSEARATVSFKLHRPDFGTDITCQAVTDPSIPPLSNRLSIDMNYFDGWKYHHERSNFCASDRRRRESFIMQGSSTKNIVHYSRRWLENGDTAIIFTDLPVVTLNLGANLDADKVVEGSDIYLDCRVRANPWYSNVHFTHNGITVKSGPGVLLANQTLVLQHVSRQAAGAYVCSATNTLGDGLSSPLILDVKYAPTCKSEQPINIRAARGEVVEIECIVDANPKVSLTYQWWFNSSTHARRELKISPSHVQNEASTFVYVVNSSADYGPAVQCVAFNLVGSQTLPCVYHILPAEKPSAVRNCDITNVTYDSLTLNCTPGHDGGVRQTLFLEVSELSYT
ncbi:unnamed protein product [Parnassius apollo]|uniref:(apollo) hypothetical protein n=1 Tax=Parnassius apollo TaxID=110799 RepID=A0A8S3XDK9_PARAO|nr:unnamed protein product [Parnassius apollo]